MYYSTLYQSHTKTYQPYRITVKRKFMLTANIKFNRVVAKENFNNNSIEELKNAIERGILSETGLIVASDMKEAKEILNPDGSLEIQKTVAGEAIAFLADETAVSVRLIQYNPHGLLRFVYTIKATEI